MADPLRRRSPIEIIDRLRPTGEISAEQIGLDQEPSRQRSSDVRPFRRTLKRTLCFDADPDRLV